MSDIKKDNQAAYNTLGLLNRFKYYQEIGRIHSPQSPVTEVVEVVDPTEE